MDWGFGIEQEEGYGFGMELRFVGEVRLPKCSQFLGPL